MTKTVYLKILKVTDKISKTVFFLEKVSPGSQIMQRLETLKKSTYRPLLPTVCHKIVNGNFNFFAIFQSR